MGILDFGFWILDFGFWILDFGFWIGDWDFGLGFWIGILDWGLGEGMRGVRNERGKTDPKSKIPTPLPDR
jgi:hypothetical protein